MRRPRKIAIKLVLFVLLGAIINVAVAWGCVLWSDADSTIQRSRADAEALAAVAGLAAAPGDDLAAQETRGLGLSLTDLAHTADYRIEESSWIYITSAGMPLRSLKAEWRGYGRPISRNSSACWAVRIYRFQSHGGLRLSPSVRKPDPFAWLLPCNPIWIGFGVNTLFYGSILWACLYGRSTLRRYLRARRGCCLHCGYDLRGQPVDSKKCPECGRSSPLRFRGRGEATEQG